MSRVRSPSPAPVFNNLRAFGWAQRRRFAYCSVDSAHHFAHRVPASGDPRPCHTGREVEARPPPDPPDVDTARRVIPLQPNSRNASGARGGSRTPGHLSLDCELLNLLNGTNAEIDDSPAVRYTDVRHRFRERGSAARGPPRRCGDPGLGDFKTLTAGDFEPTRIETQLLQDGGVDVGDVVADRRGCPGPRE